MLSKSYISIRIIMYIFNVYMYTYIHVSHTNDNFTIKTRYICSAYVRYITYKRSHLNIERRTVRI